MSTFKFWLKITRPFQWILGGIATWIVALLSDGPDWFGLEKVIAGSVMSLGILGASVWHYGARADVYARKHWDPVIVKNPLLLLCIGGIAFLLSIILSWMFLSRECLAIAVINMITIILYGRFLDRYWPWKNLFIAGICVTPMLLGWFSGHRLNPIVPSLILASFFFYLSREIFKDVMDIEANRGKRFTMVMSLGTQVAIKVGGLILATSILIILYSLKYAPFSLFIWGSSILGVVWLSWFALKSIRGQDITHKFPLMDLGVASMLLALLGVRLSMH
jgi:4-hydroxybenzoate polyprenyltransferase